jgi:hypothetical protein
MLTPPPLVSLSASRFGDFAVVLDKAKKEGSTAHRNLLDSFKQEAKQEHGVWHDHKLTFTPVADTNFVRVEGKWDEALFEGYSEIKARQTKVLDIRTITSIFTEAGLEDKTKSAKNACHLDIVESAPMLRQLKNTDAGEFVAIV